MNGDGGVNYKGYTAAELREAIAAIDRSGYPLNFQNLLAEFRSRGIDPHSSGPDSISAGANGPKGKKDSLQGLVFATILSIFLLFLAGYGLYYDDVPLPTRTGVQHLHGLDAFVLYTLLLVAVPTNVIRLRAWIRDGDGNGTDYQSARSISKAAVYGFIGYTLFRLLSGGV